MIDVAAHVRIFNADPGDDLVTKRAAAVRDLSARYIKNRQVGPIFQLANDLALAADSKGAHVSDAMSKEVEAAVRKGGADAFVAEGQGLQVTVCGLMAALQSLESVSPTTGDVTTQLVMAVGLWAALGFQAPRREPKLEALRVELLNTARDFVLKSATSSRDRTKVPDLNVVAAKELDAAIIAQSATNGIRPVVNALRTNAALDREEIDLLWWVLGDWSELLDRRYSAASETVSTAIASGIEAGSMLRRMPGDAHRNLVLRHVKGSKSFTLAEVIEELGEDRARVAAPYASDVIVASCPGVFPLLSALNTGSSSHAKLKAKRSLIEWSERALLEASALHVCAQLPVVV
ncbi:MAG TPA: GTPase-associated system all-helical protein GASH [Bradyrhizobium sp.]|nr:GTPase-associated system all-helical protein GASH [Bradyrhizobium sp.]